MEIGSLVFHYPDGTTETLALVTQVNIVDYWREPGQTLDPALVVWTGRNTKGDPRAFQLGQLTWKNPHPDKTISTIDFVSAKAPAAPFLVGITLE